MTVINIYSTQTMMQAINRMMPVRTFLRDNFFGGVQTFVTEDVLVDFKKGKRKMAPFVAPRIGGVTIDREGFRTDKYTAPRMAPQRVLTKDDLAGRSMGESIISTKTPAQRQSELLGQDLAELDDMITRREEWMCREILLTGKCTMKGFTDRTDKYIEQVIDFGLTNKEALTAEAKWDQSTSTKYADLRRWRSTIMKTAGMAPTDIIIAADALELFLADPDIKARFDNTRYNLGNIAPKLFMDGAVTYVGRLVDLGLDIWMYEEYFEADDTGTITPMIPDSTLILLTQGLGRRIYGAVTQMEKDEQFYTYEGTRIPKVWADQNNETKMIKLSSRPVPAPYDVDSWFTATVK